ncbi:MAG: DNA-binding domain-containing protein [Erythrobacter sp.]|jgi:hypothetical protein|nr:DNA-binding domain-containing protein [Erythrobacter sp.]
MNLARLQRTFLAGLGDPGEGDCTAVLRSAADGFAIYRNAYRTTLIDTLRETFPRTLDYVGEASFRAAAAHHFITTPPSSWSLDHAGERFSETLTDLFADNPEAGELAALEWAMHEVFVAPDCEPLEAADFAAATESFTDEDWSNVQLVLAPFATVPCSFDLLRWWQAPRANPKRLLAPHQAIVWREEERPVFVIIERQEASALCDIARGATFGAVCERLTKITNQEEAIVTAASYLQKWLQRGWTKDFRH